jgi:hypothetical protein
MFFVSLPIGCQTLRAQIWKSGRYVTFILFTLLLDAVSRISPLDPVSKCVPSSVTIELAQKRTWFCDRAKRGPLHVSIKNTRKLSKIANFPEQFRMIQILVIKSWISFKIHETYTKFDWDHETLFTTQLLRSYRFFNFFWVLFWVSKELDFSSVLNDEYLRTDARCPVVVVLVVSREMSVFRCCANVPLLPDLFYIFWAISPSKFRV